MDNIIDVVKRDGRTEEFDVDKIARTIMEAAYAVGGTDYDQAEEIASEVQDYLEENDIHCIRSSELQQVVEERLIKRGHDRTAREYILEGDSRNRQRELNTDIMKTIEDITFSDPSNSDIKRENANIDSSTAMGVMLKYGSESAKKFNLMTVVSRNVAKAHINGDIHIHDLDFLTLTETCICKDAVLQIKENGVEKEMAFGDFMLHVVKELYKLNGVSLDRVYDLENFNIEVMSRGKYTKVLNTVAHSSIGKSTLRVSLTDDKFICLTGDHRVVTRDVSGELIDKRADELIVGEEVSVDSDNFVKVKQIEDINYMACVYDIETESHYFTANGVNVHNCCQINLEKLFRHGFNTGHGFLRTPSGIRAAGALSAIAVQSNQNDQHGGQSIPLFDFYLAPYVALTYVKQVAKIARIKFDLSPETSSTLKNKLVALQKKMVLVINDEGKEKIKDILKETFETDKVKCSNKKIDKLLDTAYDETYGETFQSMEAFVHNLNTMHSRAGAQVPFSSINYGTDISAEGRMVIETILKTTEDGLGNGETPIFPIQIFKLKAGVSYNPEDPNYDLFKLACKVSAKRLYPNFSNLDAPYNMTIYKENHPETEVAYMGCRTRVATNMYDPNMQIVPGRGNLSFTSINLPRLAIESHGNVDVFFKKLDEMLELVHFQLLERFDIQCKKHPINYPFLMGQGVWLGSEKLGPMDDIREVLKNGTLTVGFIGLAECLVALIGKHHGESKEAQELGLKIVGRMRDYTDAWSENEHMNYSVIGTPAEGLSGRFIRLDKQRYGEIPGVTDREYYTNSSHVPVYYPISATKKIEIEAPYHALENGGHIAYIEMDGDPSKNLKAFEKVVRYMHDKGIGYGAINHPVDRDPVCGYTGIIGDTCPRCGRKDGEPMTMEMWNKIKGYANAGNADTLGYHGDPYEEDDRTPNM